MVSCDLWHVFIFVTITFALCSHIIRVTAEGVDYQSRSEEDRKIIEDSGLDPNKISPEAIVIKPPTYTDEEQLSSRMPKQYECDGCKILAFQLQQRFSNAEKKKLDKEISESEIIDTVETLCNDEFKEYGLMYAASGSKYLEGPGLGRPAASGSRDRSSLWTKRLRHMCLEILDSFEEDELYQIYKLVEDMKESIICEKYCGAKKHKYKTEL